MNEKLLKAISNIGSPKILLLGDFFLDGYIYGDAVRISPEAPVPVLKVVGRENRCGGAASVASDIAALGAQAICIGVVGDDANGQELLNLLEQDACDITGIIKIKDRPTITKQRLIGLAQHRHRQQIIRIDEEVTDNFKSDIYDCLIENFKLKLEQSDIVCIQDYNKGTLNEDFCRQIIAMSKQAGKRVIVDPPSISDYDKFEGVSSMTPNRKEASMAVGFEIKSEHDAERAAIVLKNKLNMEAAIITLDRDGAYLLTDNQSMPIPTIAKTVYDVTGAGDMVLAVIATVLAAGYDWQTAIELANIAGGLEVEKFGVATVSAAEISHEIIRRLKETESKVQELENLEKRLDWHRKKGDKIVFTNGCFDVIHTGHISYLNFCKQHGDVVVVGLNSDSSVRRLKGDTRPINNQQDRAVVLSALSSVDYIVIFDQDTPLELIERVAPDVLIKGQDWEHKGVVGREFVESKGGKVVLAPMIEGKSSTKTISKMNS